MNHYDNGNGSGSASDAPIEIFSTCPSSSNFTNGEAYLRDVVDVARWSDRYGCKGMLVYTDNGLVDPWLVSQVVLQNTDHLCPLVAVQPVYLHPYAVAKMVATFGYLYGRRIYLNMVAGGFKNDLLALNDTTPHDKRYDRLVEYTTIIRDLCAGAGPVTFRGEFYQVDKLKLTPPLPPALAPGIFVSGSSDAGLAAAKKLGATAVQYPKPPAEYEEQPPDDAIDSGIRVGVIAREDEAEAWRVAYERFPVDRKGQLMQQLAMKTSDSSWHKQLSQLGETPVGEDNPYWLVPFQNYKTFCPYLVGSYECVANELARYIAVGYKRFILDVPASVDELHHINVTFEAASKQGAA
jgi:alkanesulfonate monooxygenase